MNEPLLALALPLTLGALLVLGLLMVVAVAVRWRRATDLP